jgi:hypothetical protein
MNIAVNEFEGYWTVEEASRFLTCPQPVALPILQQLGKDASLYCRINAVAWKDKPVTGKRWATERAYTMPVIREVFRLHPDVRDFLPPMDG